MANIGSEPMEEAAEASPVTLNLPEGVYPDAQDGQEVETTVKGTLSIKDGVKTLSVASVDGIPVNAAPSAQIEPEIEETPEDQQADAKQKLSDEIGKSYGRNMFKNEEEE